MGIRPSSRALSGLVLSLLLAYGPGSSPAAGEPIFAGAQSRRSLKPAYFSRLSGSQARIAPAYPYIGGSEFNSYMPVMAEENLFPGNSAEELLTVYQQSVLPLLAQWDPQARLLESRGNTQPELMGPDSCEYVYVPGLTPDKPMPIQPNWVFRFASGKRKETLTIYITSKETRIYRVVWQEPDIGITRARIPIREAIEIARQALEDAGQHPEYPDYPQAGIQLENAALAADELPERLNWSVTLDQQGEQLIYFLAVRFAKACEPSGVIVAGGSPPRTVDLFASVDIDAVSGEVLSVSRPGLDAAELSTACRSEPSVSAKAGPGAIPLAERP